jgi:flagellar basal-body rod protein FlgC
MDMYDITASALSAQRLRLDTIASNLANANTTRQADGSAGPYRRRNVVFAPMLAQAQQQGADSSDLLPMRINQQQGRLQIETGVRHSTQYGTGVQVVAVEADTTTPTRLVYDPAHPDARADGFVEMPNINTLTEMVDMISASRAYEASVTAFQTAKAMNESTLQM